MNFLTVLPENGTPLTMTSLDVTDVINAQLAEKGQPATVRHDSLKRSIERLAESGVFSLPPVVEVRIQRERREEITTVYKLDRRASIIVVAQVNPEVVAHLYDLWQAAEAKVEELEEYNKQRTENLAFREAYNLTREEYRFIHQVGKEVAAVGALINPILDGIEAKVAAMNFNPIAASKLKNDLYNNALARVFRLLKDSEVKQRQLASLDHKAYLAARKDLIDTSKYTKEQRLLMQNQAKTRKDVEDIVVADMAKLANIESLLKLQKE